jgi:leucyl aminopeptidase
MDVSIRVERASLTGVRTPLLVVNLFEAVDEPSGATGAVDEALGGLIGRLIADGEIKGSLGEVTVIHNQGDRARLAADRVAVVGLGKRDDLDLEVLRVASATAARKARDLRIGRYATVIHGAGAGGLDSRLAAKTVLEASLLSLYTYHHYKTPLRRRARPSTRSSSSSATRIAPRRSRRPLPRRRSSSAPSTWHATCRRRPATS